jgi:hypothetical protein
MECSFCGKFCKNPNSLRNHERLCNLNPNRQILVSNFAKYNIKRKELNLKGSNQFIKAKKLGLPKPVMSEITKEKISKANKGKKYTEEERLKMSMVMKLTVLKHPESYTKNNVVGRVKIMDYKGIKLKGTWEVIVAEWLDKNNVKWEYETRSFDYEWDGIKKYYPDFYLPEFNIYIEVKGFETERDRAKWKNIPNLIVFKLNEINQIKNNTLGLLSALAHNE